MHGILMNELYEVISHFHDVEFEHNGITYVLQPEIDNDKTYLVIWDCSPNAEKCVSKHKVCDEKEIPHSVIDAVLSDKCFNGKSFIEIEEEITVTVVY